MYTTGWAFELAEYHLADYLPDRWKHVQGVAAQASKLINVLGSDDAELLIMAAVLHDLGYSPSLRVTGFHPLDGARHLSDQGVPERLCALVAHHSCAYREAELRGLSAELARWQDERTVLRDALWWADMTTTAVGEPTNIKDRIEEIQRRYGPEELVTFFIRQAKPELVAAVDRTEEWLRAAGVDYTAK